MTTTPTVPVTLLQAVNEMLASVGTAQVATLTTASTDEEVQKALNTISDVAVQVQSERWAFNTDENYPINPSPVDGSISLPANANFLGVGWKSKNRKATVRNGQLYDLDNHTFIWANGSNGQMTPQPLLSSGSSGMGVLYINVQFYYPFETLPQPIRWLVLCKAARMFAVGRVPDSMTFKFTDTAYEEAVSLAHQWDAEQSDEGDYINPHLAFMGRR
ncbi:hypothetical protein M2322_002690 [Rhodoblastus acidophilus]|uniref:hypothetical protein n=1 Tax=Rhodoblastus acidophilus TaxID=1074 RepID=UPI002224A6F1|nr:hypothetical protein [Rhodoblastus acidophilus]